MKKIGLIALVALFTGCASYSYSHVHGNGTYNYDGVPITANVDVYSCVGTCPSMNEVMNCSK